MPFLVQTRERTCTIKCRTKGGRDGAYPPNIVYMEYMYAAMQEIPQKEKKSTRLSIAYVQRNLKVAPCMCHRNRVFAHETFLCPVRNKLLNKYADKAVFA